MSSRRLLAALLAALLLAPLAAVAQERGRTIRLIVPFPPGGAADAYGRVLAPALGPLLGASIVLDNRAGAGGLIGLEACARAAPDGATLCFGTSGTHTVTPFLHPGRVGADPAGFTPIARLTTEPAGLFLRADHRARTLEEFIAWGRTRDKVHFATTGISSGTLLTILFGDLARVPMEPVVYRGGAAGQTALLAGEVPVAMGVGSQFLGFVRSGEMRGILAFARERPRLMPEVPAIGESLMPDFNLSAFQGLFGPAGLPPAVTERVVAALRALHADPAFRARVEELGVDLAFQEPAEFAAWLAAAQPVWRELFGRAQALLPADPANPAAAPR